MSGSSAPVSCRNANPSAREATEVNANFAGLAAATIDPARFAGTFQD
jgi:snapalysin